MWIDILRARPEVLLSGAALYTATVVHGDDVVGVASMRPPHPLQVSALTPLDALPLVVEDLISAGRVDDVTDVVSSVPVAERFVALWQQRTGRAGEVRLRERLHRIDAAPDVPATPGHFRLGADGDVPLLARWYGEFAMEAFGDAPDPAIVLRSTQALVDGRGGGIAVWEAGGQVACMVGWAGTMAGTRIAPVYTPPSLRGRGYGTAATAATTRHLFESGRRGVFLFTDLANPTSNHIYAQIGYRPVDDYLHCRMLPPPR